MRGKLFALCLTLALAGCGGTQGTNPGTVQESETLVGTVTKEEIQDPTLIIQLEELEELPMQEYKERPVLSGERIPDEGYSLGKLTAEVYHYSEIPGETGIFGEVLISTGTPRSLYQLREEGIINELTGNENYIAWAVATGGQTAVYLYDRRADVLTKLDTFPASDDAVLLSLGQENLLCRRGWVLYSYDLATQERRELSQDLSTTDVYGRPENSNGVVIIQEGRELVQLDLLQNRQRRSSLGEGMEITGLKGNWAYIAWRGSDRSVHYFHPETGECFALSSDENIFSYHISGHWMALNLSDSIILVNLANNTKCTLLNSPGEFINYGRVLPDGSIQFLAEGLEDVRYITIPIEK